MNSVPLALMTQNLNIHHHSDWLIFADRLDASIRSGRARRMQPLRQVFAPSEEWYVDASSGEIYVYLRPDDKVLPEWVSIDPFGTAPTPTLDPKSLSESGLRAIPIGVMDRTRGESLSFLLGRMIKQKRIEAIPLRIRQPNEIEHINVSLFRDTWNDVVYELVLFDDGRYFWHPLPEIKKAARNPILQ